MSKEGRKHNLLLSSIGGLMANEFIAVICSLNLSGFLKRYPVMTGGFLVEHLRYMGGLVEKLQH
jgi:hypothetical protein